MSHEEKTVNLCTNNRQLLTIYYIKIITKSSDSQLNKNWPSHPPLIFKVKHLARVCDK